MIADEVGTVLDLVVVRIRCRADCTCVCLSSLLSVSSASPKGGEGKKRPAGEKQMEGQPDPKKPKS